MRETGRDRQIQIDRQTMRKTETETDMTSGKRETDSVGVRGRVADRH